MPAPIVSKEPEQALPRVVGGFRLLRELGRGGMGVVYQAEELSSGRSVALKVLAADQRVSEEAFERFRREARMAAAISDSRCVFVYGAHQVDGSPAIAMELCPGETLEHRLAKHEPIPVQKAVRWALEILEGLEAAHRAGVIHRDVKPSNCFITQDERVKVGDFGLSRSLDTDIRLTQSGAFLGSPLYASPEQIKGREVDARSDIYSTGATLFALLAGRAPYHGQNIGEVLARILSEEPPALRSIRADIPADLEKVVMRAMERDPERRFPDHASFRSALEGFVAGEAIPAPRIRRVIAYVLDQMLTGSLSAGFMFTGMAQAWDWTAMDPARPWRVKSTVAILAINAWPCIYYALAEGLAGTTLAKWMLGMRVVDVQKQQASLWRAAVRAVAFMTPALVCTGIVANADLDQRGFTIWSYVGGAVSFMLLASTMRRANGFRGMHELVSGTRTIEARSPFARFRRAKPVPVQPLESADAWPAELGTYKLEGAIGSTPSGVLLRAVDRELDRSVWIIARTTHARATSDERRALARQGRLRWLDSARHGDTHFEMYEAPGGSSLSHCLAQSEAFNWPTAHRILSGLAEELATAPGNDFERVCFEQLWIDRDWNVRVLDEPLALGAVTHKAPLDLLSDAARAMLFDKDRQDALPADLPLSAETVIRRLGGIDAPYESIQQASSELASLAGRPMSLSPTARAAQIAVSLIPAVVPLAASVVVLFALTDPIDRALEVTRAVRQLQAQDAKPPPAEIMDSEDRRARELVIRHLSATPWTPNMLTQITAAERAIYDRAVAAHAAPSAEELQSARDRIRERPFKKRASDVADGAQSAADRDRPLSTNVGRFGQVSVNPEAEQSFRKIRWLILPMLCALTVGLWGLMSTLLALIFRGGLSFKLFGIGVRNKRGELAGRMRCAWRSLIVWVPLTIAYAFAARFALNERLVLGFTLAALTASAHAGLLALAMLRPTRGLQDKLAGTRLVPR